MAEEETISTEETVLDAGNIDESLSQETQELESDDSLSQSEEEAGGNSEELIERAKEYGLSEDDLRSLGDNPEAAMEKFAELYDRTVADMGRGLLEQGKPSSPEVKTPEVPAPAPTGEQEMQGIADKLAAAGYDGELIEVVQALENKIAELMPLKEQFNTAAEAKMAAESQQKYDELNNFFANPPEKFKLAIEDSLGGKKLSDLEGGSKEFQFVNAVANEIDALNVGYRQQGKQFTLQQLGERALAIHCQEKLKELTERQVAGQLNKRKRGGITKPTGRGVADTGLPSNAEEERAMVESMMRESGLLGKSLAEFAAST